MTRASSWLRLRRVRALAAALVAVTVGEIASAAEPPDESTRWTPSFAVMVDILGQRGEGSVASGPVLGAPLDPFDAEQDAIANGTGCLVRAGNAPPFTFSRSGELCITARPDRTKLLPDSQGHDTSVTPMVGGSFELMTPRLLEEFLRPRLFVHGDALAAFSFERNLAGTDGPDDFTLPPDIRPRSGQTLADVDVEELSIRGQGSRARMQVRPLVLSAGAGIAFSFDAFGRRLRLKPSFEYLHQELDLIGVVHRAVKLRTPAGIADLSGFRLVSLTSKEQRSYDGIGPGLELEVDATRLGSFISSVYVMGRGYYLLGDLETVLAQANEVGEWATWTFDPDPWVWRAGVGFRLRWSPEE